MHIAIGKTDICKKDKRGTPSARGNPAVLKKSGGVALIMTLATRESTNLYRVMPTDRTKVLSARFNGRQCAVVSAPYA